MKDTSTDKKIYTIERRIEFTLKNQTSNFNSNIISIYNLYDICIKLDFDSWWF